MSSFIHDDFLLGTDAARELFHGHAERQPIIDYHCHLSPRQIAENVQFGDITELWLGGDHYKWRAMRGNGIPEAFITGSTTSSWEKFRSWAGTMPYLMRNPLYHWTHLELKRVFGIDRVLGPSSARDIFEECNALLATPGFRGKELIRRFDVEVVCTTDDPADDLRWHRQIAQDPFGTRVLPTWRPDKAMALEAEGYARYIGSLGEAAGMEIRSYEDLCIALQKRHDFFDAMGCRLSDHGMDTFYADDAPASQVEGAFGKALAGKRLSAEDISAFRSRFMLDQGIMDADAGWTQQFHVGPLRNCNSRMFASLGPDTGFDAIGDRPCAEAGHRFLDSLEKRGKLARTILYCLNPKDFEVMAAMAYTFNDGSVPGKMQLGSGWWFLDQEDGMRRQMNALSALGLLSRFVGMLTDSRSFISYPRHEYFRRILCDILGSDIESGRLPASEMDFLGKMVEGISYGNARDYFKF